MIENPYQSPEAVEAIPQAPKRRSRYLAYAVLTVGVFLLVQGVAMRYLGVNLLQGLQNSTGLTPVYTLFWGVGVCVVGLAIKTFSERK